MKIIGIAGGSGSGKTTLVNKISETFNEKKVGILSLDYYYRDNSHIPLEEREHLNFDHPNAIEFELIIQQINQLKAGIEIEVPQYSYITCTRLLNTIKMQPPEILIIEGILTFYEKALRNAFDLRIFINLNEQERLKRITERDILERGRDEGEVISRFYNVVNKMHEQFVQPAEAYADYVFSAINLKKDAPNFSKTILNDPRITIP